METSNKMQDALIRYIRGRTYILEPHAGDGSLALNIIQKKQCDVDVIELNSELFALLKQEERFHNRIHGDFLKQTHIKDTYDHVVMVPPYKDNVDCQHIMHAFTCTRPGGSVITFTLPYWITGNYSNQIEFRKWLSNKDFSIELFEDDESYLSCPKMLLVIRK